MTELMPAWAWALGFSGAVIGIVRFKLTASEAGLFMLGFFMLVYFL